MHYAKTVALGGVLFVAGYCVGSSTTEKKETLEQTVTQLPKGTEKTLFDFLKEHEGKYAEKETIDFKTIWDSIPPNLQLQLMKQFATNQLEEGYDTLKGKSVDMYEELSHYLQKKLGGN